VLVRGPDEGEQITARTCRGTGQRSSRARPATPAGLTRYDYRGGIGPTPKLCFVSD